MSEDRKLWILGREWKLQQRELPPDCDYVGYCDVQNLTITLKAGMERKRFFDILAHELCHAIIYHTHGISRDKVFSEEDVCVIAENLVRCLKDNGCLEDNGFACLGHQHLYVDAGTLR